MHKKIIDEQGVTEESIQKMIQEHQPHNMRMRNLYERYKADAEGPKIFGRSPVKYAGFERDTIQRLDDKVNNKLNNAFDAEIVDTKVGYLLGSPISYEVDEEAKGTPLHLAVSEFAMRNNVADMDSEWGKMAAICGYAARLVYLDAEGNERIANLDPWEVCFVGDMHEPDYSLRYFEYDNMRYVEFYDNTNVYTFTQKSGLHDLVDIKEHLFDYNPLFGVSNNKELKGDAEKVLALIDAYDRTLSDASNEIEQYRLAYLVLKGMGADEETLDKLKKTGIFELMDEKEDVNYLTKDINDQMIENHLDRLEENIMRFAKSVNFSDETFGTQISGVAMKYKLMALENKCITMERKMVAALRYQFKVLCSAWAKRGKCNAEDYLKIWYGFKRNLPANLLDEAQTTVQLKGNVSEKTRLSLLSFVDDTQFELDEMKKEQEEAMAAYPMDPLGDGDEKPE